MAIDPKWNNVKVKNSKKKEFAELKNALNAAYHCVAMLEKRGMTSSPLYLKNKRAIPFIEKRMEDCLK